MKYSPVALVVCEVAGVPGVLTCVPEEKGHCILYYTLPDIQGEGAGASKTKVSGSGQLGS